VIDSGVNVPYSKEILPSEDRIKGKHISEEISKQFEDVKNKIGV
jgi:large subunit ribosomal protein L18